MWSKVNLPEADEITFGELTSPLSYLLCDKIGLFLSIVQIITNMLMGRLHRKWTVPEAGSYFLIQVGETG